MAGKGFRYMSGRRRRDKNHAEVQEALTLAGRFVADLSGVGKGVLDLLVMHTDGHLRLMEIKDEDGQLTPAQVAFIERWPDACCVVRTVADALAAVGLHTETERR